MRLILPELALLNLFRKVTVDDPEYMPDADAWEALRRESDLDFGEDLNLWLDWIDEKYPIFRIKEKILRSRHN